MWQYKDVLGFKCHPSWYLVAASLGVVFGVALAYFVVLDINFLALSVSIFLGLFLIFYLKPKSFVILILCFILALILAWWRASLLKQALLIYDQLFDEKLTFSAQVNDDAGRNGAGAYVYRLGRVGIFQRKLPGEILLTTNSSLTVKRGDEVLIEARLSPGLVGYQALAQRAKVLKVRTNNNLALNLREAILRPLKQKLSPLQASLASAFLTGKRRQIPSDFSTKLQMTGLVHLVVASGFHLGVMLRLVKRLTVKYSRKLSFWLMLVAVLLFAAVAGLGSSLARASLVAVLSALAWYYGRQVEAWRILLLSLAVLVLLNPLFLWGNVAFYLSFLAFAGVLIVAPIFRQYFLGKTKINFFGQLLSEALAAQLTTLPISLLFFGKLSSVALISNLLVVPVAAPIMFFTAATSLFSYLPLIGDLVTYVLQILLNYLIVVVNFLAKIPLAYLPLQINLSIALALYCALILAITWLWRRNRQDEKMRQALNQVNLID